jgi:hypothetical protein
VTTDTGLQLAFIDNSKDEELYLPGLTVGSLLKIDRPFGGMSSGSEDKQNSIPPRARIKQNNAHRIDGFSDFVHCPDSK